VCYGQQRSHGAVWGSVEGRNAQTEAPHKVCDLESRLTTVATPLWRGVVGQGTDLADDGRPPPSTCYAGELYTKQILDASLHCAPFGFRQTATSPLAETPSKRYRSQSSRVPSSRRVAPPTTVAHMKLLRHALKPSSAPYNSGVYKRAGRRKQRGLS
jgi:hypothetical protein